MLFAGGLGLMALAVGLRLLPSRRGVLGVDAWFYRLHAEALRRGRGRPARLPQYLLADERQRYPPLFPLLLSLLPEAALDRVQPWIAPVLDAVQLVLLLATAQFLGLDLPGTLVAGLVYATTPDLAHEYGTLSPRPLASLLLTLAALAAAGAAGLAFACCVLVVALLLLTHKLATQLLIVLLPALAIGGATWRPVLTGVLGAGLALLASRGFYVEVWRAHLAILRYWRRHVTFRGAHPVYDSPLYAHKAPSGWRSTRLYAGGLAGHWRLLRVLLARNPWILLAAPAAAADVDSPRFVLVWAGATYAVAAATLFVPALRFLGEGFRYLKFAAFPLALIVGSGFGASPRWPWVAAVLGVSLYVTARLLRVRPLEVMDPDFADALAILRLSPRERVAVLPTHRADAVAWLARKKVLWGGQSSGYDALANLVPVLRRPFRDQLDEHHIDLVLLDRQYVEPGVLDLAEGWTTVWGSDRHVVLERAPAAPDGFGRRAGQGTAGVETPAAPAGDDGSSALAAEEPCS